MSPVIRESRPSTSSAKTTSTPQSKRSALRQNDNERPTKRKKVGRAHQKHIPGSRKIVNELLPSFSRQLSAMLSAGMPIVYSLEALEEQTDHPGFKAVITRLQAGIEGGSAFSESLQMFPSVFDDLYVNMVRGGESGGQLAETIGRLAGFLDASARLRRKVKSALMYPTIVLSISIILAVSMIVFIVPVFGDMYKDFGAELPGPTQFLQSLSGFFRSNGLYLLIGLGIIGFAFRKWKRSPAGAYTFDQFVLKAPVFGQLASKVASARFARTFAQLIRSGVPILGALEIVSGATGNKVAERVILDARESVEKGDPLSSAMLTQAVFPLMLVRMLQAGEKTGNIDSMMENIADFFDDEVETMLEGLTSLLEPLLMVFLGIIIGGIVLCMFLPIFKMGEVVSQF